MNQQDVKTITTTIEEENLVDEEINKLYTKYTQTIAYNRQLKTEINKLQQKVDTIKSQEFIAKLKTADIPNKVRRILKLSKDYNSQINQLKASSSSHSAITTAASNNNNNNNNNNTLLPTANNQMNLDHLNAFASKHL